MVTRRTSFALTGASLAAIYGTCVAIALTLLPRHPALGPAIAFDLTVTAGGVFWLLAVRPGHAPPRALVPVLLIGLTMALRLGGLRSLGVVGVLVEAIAFAWIVLRVRRIAADVRTHRRAGHGLTAALEHALAQRLPRALASVLASELGAVSLALTGWFRRAPEGFSMHRRTSYLAVMGVFLFLVAVESLAVHLFLAHVSPVAAWIATGLAIYSALWLLGDAHAVRLSPIRVIAGALVIEKGVRWRVVVPLAEIAAATPIDGRVDGALDFALLGPNVLLSLRSPVVAHGLFGVRRSITQLTLGLDDRDAFLARLA